MNGFTRAIFNLPMACAAPYLQKEIRATRRNGDALKLSNLLQLDRFEDDLNITKVRLQGSLPAISSTPRISIRPRSRPLKYKNVREQAKAVFARLRQELNDTPKP